MKKFFLLTGAAVLLIPLSSILPIAPDVWLVHYLALISLFFLTISLVLWQFNRYLSIFTILCWVSTVYVAGAHPRSLLILFQVDLSSLMVMLISKFDSKQRKQLVWLLITSSVIQALWSYVQFLNIDPIFHDVQHIELDDTVGSIGSKNQLALYLGVISPFIIGYFPVLFPVIIFGLCVTTTTTVWCSVLFVLTSLGVFKFKSKSVFILLFFGILFCFYFINFEYISHKAFEERINIAKYSIEAVIKGKIVMEHQITKTEFKRKEIKCNPFLGFGLGNFMRISPYTQGGYIKSDYPDMDSPTGKRMGHRYAHAHNDYVELFFDMGIDGILSILFLLVDIIFRFIRAKKTKLMVLAFSALSIHAISALGIFTVHTATSGFLLILIWGILEGELRDGKNTGMV